MLKLTTDCTARPGATELPQKGSRHFYHGWHGFDLDENQFQDLNSISELAVKFAVKIIGELI